MEITKDGTPIIFKFKCGACGQEWTARAGEKTVALTGYHEFGRMVRVFGEAHCTNCGTLTHASAKRRN